MTPQEKIIALAKLDGWIGIRDSSNWEQWDEPPSVRQMVYNNTAAKELPNYLTSYDAIIPLVQKMDAKTKLYVSAEFTGYMEHFDATPSEIADALLKTKGINIV